MASSKRSSPARVLPFKGGGGQVSSSGNKAIRLFLSMVAENVIEQEAWEEAGRLAFRPRMQLTDSGNCHLVSTSTGGYTGTPRNGNMTKTATKSPKKKMDRHNPQRIEPPYQRGAI